MIKGWKRKEQRPIPISPYFPLVALALRGKKEKRGPRLTRKETRDERKKKNGLFSDPFMYTEKPEGKEGDPKGGRRENGM